MSVVYACARLCVCLCANMCVGTGMHACGGQRSTLCLLHVIFHIRTSTQAYTDDFLLRSILSWVWSSTEVPLSLPPSGWSSRCVPLHPGFHAWAPGITLGFLCLEGKHFPDRAVPWRLGTQFGGSVRQLCCEAQPKEGMVLSYSERQGTTLTGVTETPTYVQILLLNLAWWFTPTSSG